MRNEQEPTISELNQILTAKREWIPFDQPGLREWLKELNKYEIVNWLEDQFAIPLTDVHHPRRITLDNHIPYLGKKPRQYWGTFSLYASDGDILKSKPPIRKLILAPPEKPQSNHSRTLHVGRLKSGAWVEIAANYSPRLVHQEIEGLSVATDRDQFLNFRILIKEGQPVLQIQEADQFRPPTKEEKDMFKLSVVNKDRLSVNAQNLALRLEIPLKFLPPAQH